MKKLFSLYFLFAWFSMHAQLSQIRVLEDWNTASGTQNFFHKSVTTTDAVNNVYVAGATVTGNGDYDILVAKYSNTGSQLWVNQYAGSGGLDDYATAILLDGSGNVYITGTVINTLADSNNIITIKYNNSGTQQWASTLHGGSGGDYGADIFVHSGNVYVCGTSYRGSTDKYDVAAVKYNSSGTQQWAAYYDYNDLPDGGARLRLTNSNTQVAIAAAVTNSSTDYRTAVIKFNESTGAFSNANVSSSIGIGYTMVFDATSDAQDNFYVTGCKANTGVGLDYYTIKYDSMLTQLWTATYNGSGNLNDEAKGVTVDGSGNVYVSGYSTSSTQGKNFVTVKYNSSGSQQWAASYNGPANGDDEAMAVVLDASGNLVVAGYSYNGTSKDYYTIKYDPSGSIVWEIGFNGLINKDDRVFDIALDTNNNVIVTGQVQTSDTTLEYRTVKYVEKTIITVADTAQIDINYLFVENRGQLVNTQQQAIPEIRYYNASTTYPHVFMSDTSLSLIFQRADTVSANTDTIQRVDIMHIGQASGRIYPLEKQSPYQNFFYPHANRGRCQEYQRLYQPNLYAGIDLEYASSMSGLKTYYIFKPSAMSPSPSAITMKFNGADSVSVLGSGKLAVYTKLGSYVIERPAAWQVNGSGAFVSLGWQPSFVETSPNEIQFTGIGSYNTALHLVIAFDRGYFAAPAMTIYNNIWSTYVHGAYNCEGGIGVTSDAQGRSYFTGTTQSFNFPFTFGALFTTFTGLQDAYYMRFNTNNSQDYATFIGGSHVDVGQDIQLDPSGNIVVVGYTKSNDFPPFASGQQYSQTNVQNDFSMFVFKIDNTGQFMQWSTPFGGDDSEYTDFGRHLAIDPNGAIYLSGITFSDNSEGFPVLSHINGNPSAYNQTTFGGGSSDGFLAKFSNNGVQAWTTYFGGSGDDYITSVGYDNGFSKVYVSGHTSSSTGYVSTGVPPTGDFPLTTSSGGFNQQAYGGGNNDAFIAKFDNTAEIEWSTYYGGSGDEYLHNIMAIRPDLYTLVGATTTSTGSTSTPCATPNSGEMPVCDPGGTSTYNANNAGSTDIFIAQFDGGDVLRYATFYGGTGDEYPSKPNYDASGAVYFGGYTIGNGFPTVDPGNNYYKQANNADATGNSGDGFVMKIYNQEVLWATHYGGYFSNSTPNCNNNHEWFMEVAPFSNTKLFGTGISISAVGVGFGNIDWPYRCGSPQYCFVTPQSGAWLQDTYVCEFDLTGGVGLQEQVATNSGDFSVFPNPTNSILTIKQGATFQKDLNVSIYNLLGELVYAKNLDSFHAFATFTVDVSQYPTGMYVVNIASGNVSTTRKFLKQE